MAKKNRKQRAKKTNAVVERFLRPTPEREAHNDFRSAGAAVQVVPPIVSLHEQDMLTDEEFVALSYYRDQANLADHSPVRDSIGKLMHPGGGGNGPSVAILSARRETYRIEAEMLSLARLCRAVCVDDVPVEAWADAHRVEPGIVILELKYAAGGIVR